MQKNGHICIITAMQGNPQSPGPPFQQCFLPLVPPSLPRVPEPSVLESSIQTPEGLLQNFLDSAGIFQCPPPM